MNVRRSGGASVGAASDAAHQSTARSTGQSMVRLQVGVRGDTNIATRQTPMGSESGVQIVTALAERITRLLDESGASRVERYSALEIARVLVAISPCSVLSPAESEPIDSGRPQ